MSYFVYILHSKSHNKYYIGQTHDLNTRILFHNSLASNSYTSKFRPWDIYFYFNIPSRSVAMKLEKYLKKKPRRFLLRIKNDNTLQEYIYSRFK